ncbi:MAG TPA: lytic murein transglycosylase [Solirubrobacterales bacterium]|jgi:membrane-bound lytic murein transglycosylase B|nr:lytic murein transglycosylase [Solirubrobacterales bacterium]
MERARQIRAVVATAAATAALAVPVAVARAEAASSAAPTPGATLEAPPVSAENPAAPAEDKETVKHGATLVPPPPPATHMPPPNGGVNAGGEDAEVAEPEATETETGATTAAPGPTFVVPSLPASSCAISGVPPALIPIYQNASARYGLGPQGPAVLAGINAVETAFGTNLGPSSAGAVGWMQFMPATWATYGVDANGDGVKDPNNPEDAIYAAAGYLKAAGMPADTYGAIFAYNHADWYVEEVLANAGCYADEVGSNAFSATGLGPQIQVLRCVAAPDWKKQIPEEYLAAFEDAAARYELGKRGVWTLAAIARLESNFGRGMGKQQMRTEGALGLDAMEWRRYAVDGDNDGHVRHGDIADSAATLARLIWARGSIEAGVFTHNQAEWYVQEVLQQAAEIEGGCKVSYLDWRVAPLATGFETPGPNAVLTPEGLASAPRSVPPAVKAAIAAANSISTTPYVWGGGHGSWYSYGYDCSGAVSFALYGAGLLDTPLTSGALESYGEPGPGRWITIYASATHTYAVIAGLRWDTVGDAEGTGPRWHPEPPYPDGFVVRHPPGY